MGYDVMNYDNNTKYNAINYSEQEQTKDTASDSSDSSSLIESNTIKGDVIDREKELESIMEQIRTEKESAVALNTKLYEQGGVHHVDNGGHLEDQIQSVITSCTTNCAMAEAEYLKVQVASQNLCSQPEPITQSQKAEFDKLASDVEGKLAEAEDACTDASCFLQETHQRYYPNSRG